MKTRVRIPFELQLGDRTMEAAVNLPEEAIRVADLLPVLLSFSEAISSVAKSIIEEDGLKISCRAGCGACCRQLVPVSEAEALYLAEFVAAMPPEHHARVRERFRHAVAALGEDLIARLRDTESLKELEERRKIGLEYFRIGVACPFLEQESCSIHPHRPTSCREYLVTSPPENCTRAGPMEPVLMPVKLSEILYCFGDGVGHERTRWVPLVLALEWAAQNGGAQPAYPAVQMFRNFLGQIARAASRRQE